MTFITWIGPSTLTEVISLLLAFGLSAIIGLERHRQANSAGLRTHTLVGLGSAMFTLVSGYGFAALLGDAVALDPSRIAAQVVSGIGFLGGGVIFVRQNIVNGLTTAATIWVVAAVGMACGAGMPILAMLGTALHLVAVRILTYLARAVPQVGAGTRLVIVYKDGRGILRDILERASDLGFDTSLVATRRHGDNAKPRIEAVMDFRRGRVPMSELVAGVQSISGVKTVGPDNDEL